MNCYTLLADWEYCFGFVSFFFSFFLSTVILSGSKTLCVQCTVMEERKDLSFPWHRRKTERERRKWKNYFAPLCKLKFYITGNCLQNPWKGKVAVTMAFCNIPASSVDSPSLILLPSIFFTFGPHFVGGQYDPLVRTAVCLLEFLEFCQKSLYMMVPSLEENSG